MTLGMICIYFQFIGRDAFTYLSYLDGFYFLMVLLPYFFAVESPKWLIIKGRQEEARQALEYIQRVNKTIYSSSDTTSGFQNVRIFLN